MSEKGLQKCVSLLPGNEWLEGYDDRNTSSANNMTIWNRSWNIKQHKILGSKEMYINHADLSQ